MYQYHGDIRALEENFEMIKGWLTFLDSHVENNLLNRYGGRWDFLGDWLWPGANAAGMNNYSDENLFFNNCYWVYNLKTAAQIARIIGRETDAEIWSEKAKLASEAIHQSCLPDNVSLESALSSVQLPPDRDIEQCYHQSL
jgi:alpha-L-rhamnosidase